MLGNLNDVDLRMLRTFCTIVEAGGFTAAQVRLNMSLPRLSVVIRDLEIRVGYSLCKRGKSGFQLTDEGMATYTAAQELFADIERFRQKTVAVNGRSQEHLQLGTVDSLATMPNSPLPCAIARFRKSNPRVRLQLHVMRPDELEQAVLEERLHLAIGAFHHRLSGLDYKPLFDEEQNLYCSAEHPFFNRPDESLTIDEISASDYVDRGYVAENRRPYELHFRNMISAFSMEAIALLLFSGSYIGYLPTHYAQTWVEQGRLRPILADRLSYISSFHCITRQGLQIQTGLAGFLAALMIDSSQAATE
ncbi:MULTISPECIES: LysR family transcriptional regulator [Pseudomonas]|uniref:LysR family transcriptional regulator n=1 Tax=Pseudomonas auratipiscis TaxID=3115853 RepID=A0AB35WXZ9_9PSED|nr:MULTISPECIES: LysR family transcriptional regulator [unclassified Pseudomonas]MEE1866959.1 LysR family transcriptional regulator [Pseudomonas sp. 120P]MEE1957786.1 LysR family transcriptional regulator [Pseudomonas sp. 119P]